MRERVEDAIIAAIAWTARKIETDNKFAGFCVITLIVITAIMEGCLNQASFFFVAWAGACESFHFHKVANSYDKLSLLKKLKKS